jgi:site-specific DNA recombinase
MKRVALYARYSTDLQKPTSIEDQFRVCIERVEKEADWEVVAQYSDYEMSGTTMNKRTGLNAMLADARTGNFDLVVMEALDRLSRDQGDTANLHKELRFYQVGIFTLSEGHVDRMQVGLKGLMNEMQIDEISRKTLRGQRGRVEAGFIASGLTYGYDAVRRFGDDGKPVRGERVINPDQAAIVLRIFEEYARGDSPIKICRGLERDGIPSPQGKKCWSVSTVNGCRRRHYGMLNNDIYRGVIVWNRTKDVREPKTGRKIARPKPESEWVYKDAPKLRIISDELWEAVKARQGRLELKTNNWRKKRPQSLVSGLMRCGVCGSPFVKHNQTRFACTRRHGDITCTHRLSIRQDEIETAIVEALRAKLMDPRLVKVFCEEYTRHLNELRRNENATRAGYETELQKLERTRKRCVQAIMDGVPASQVKDELRRIEERRQEVEGLLAGSEELPPIIHPKMSLHYQKHVAKLTTTIEDANLRAEAQESLRLLVEKIVLTPNAEGTALVVDLYGDLAGIMSVAEAGQRFHSLPRQVRIKAAQAANASGGRYKDRTCDPYDVNVVLYR